VERAMRDALFAAYFGAGRDIGRIDVLVEIGEGCGLDRTELKVTLDIDQHTEEIEREEEEAVRLGLQGVPAYVDLDRAVPRAVIGLQKYDSLVHWMESSE
jgi:predicted DsbA family dithiol-disulfide isomerase